MKNRLAHPTLSKAGYFPFSEQTVLVVEDHLPSQRIIREVLSGLGVRSIHLCANTRDALGAIRLWPIDLAIVDIALEDEDGIEFVRYLRASRAPGLARVPILMVSAFTTHAKVMEAGAAGVDGFLSKPISVGGLAHRTVSAITARTFKTNREVRL